MWAYDLWVKVHAVIARLVISGPPIDRSMNTRFIGSLSDAGSPRDRGEALIPSSSSSARQRPASPAANRTGTRGAPGAIAAGVTRVRRTVEAIVGAHFVISVHSAS